MTRGEELDIEISELIAEYPGTWGARSGLQKAVRSPNLTATAKAMIAAGHGLTPLTQAEWDDRLTWTVDDLAAHLTGVIKDAHPLAQAHIAKALARHDEPIASEVLAKAFGPEGLMLKLGPFDHDPTSPPLTPQAVNGRNVLHGTDAANAAKVKAIMERHRHPVTGQYTSGRSAAAIQHDPAVTKSATGLFSYTTRQTGAR